MKVLVIGSGLIGLTTAYFLARNGHAVTVIDRNLSAGEGASFANGGLLTPSMAEPWNSPGCWRVLLSSSLVSDAPLQLRWSALPGLFEWGIKFLRNSSAKNFERNSLSNLRLSLFSLKALNSIALEAGLHFGHVANGTLRLFYNHQAFEDARRNARKRISEGLNARALSVTEAVAFEPGLLSIASKLSGAMHYELDETGDAYQFCQALAAYLRATGVEFRFNAEVTSIWTRSGTIEEVRSYNERYVADCYIMAAGSYSTTLLSRIGMAIPVRPAKGYSLTVSCFENAPPIRVPIVDDQRHAVVVPLGNTVRIAGTAEFAGYDMTLRADRVRNLTSMLREILPRWQYDLASARAWCGLRPMSVDGVPIIGRTPLSNLFLNTGHGHLGWTMAAGSGQLLADIISGRRASIDTAPYSLARFSSAT